MDIILLERIEKLGQMGDIVTVKNGYARNFLLPQRKALRATDANKKYFEAKRSEIEAQNLKRRQEAEEVGKRVDQSKVVLIRQAGESGQLYGSVATRDIAQALSDEAIKVERSQIELNRPIKTLGLFDVAVRLHAEVAVTVIVNVARSAEEAERQFESGRAIVGDEPEEDEVLDAEAIVEDLVEDESIVEELAAEADAESGDDGDDEAAS
ncbi:LSU ribosomal protein L9P [Rhodothalassium salexigens DSM 2132]|uniref:Large ribosomal subunit protein bL9 n=1 Tax=Rhodothalassium salexigens DSM 2132 TaxID=1188247 RepID=A0A4R2PRE7_RHOSA|nr:50S ribosomal protein L9 [Rhodothalassium salexigens]MBB4210279.1 large subunit ribosomal protein L9 [Rhodothalassium salexigens DSM 2132]MBK1638799.1 50S ribosomal protein L9 [Rhodothalassium salexigens DSM 2132]MBK5920875.1 50S ribosomal protein L9 [Rhodothalassium salexigens]TCP38443.1 LSU ribosomal protein L9P [Rhodothalassium salexigens DSM 2132]